MQCLGRSSVRTVVRELVGAGVDEPSLVYVHGTPGIGVSTLLEQLTRDLSADGCTVRSVEVSLTPTERARTLRDAIVPVDEPTVLVVDDWNTLSLDQAALVELLEGATGPLTLLVGSPHRPGPETVASALDPSRVRVLELGGLEQDVLIELLARRGVSASRARRIHRTCDGHPFAAFLLAESHDTELPAFTGGIGEGVSMRLVEHLLARTDDDVRRGLASIALAGSANELELREALGIDTAAGHRLFDRLRALTLVRPTAGGLTLDPIVRSALVRDMLTRDPPGARSLVRGLLGPIRQALSWFGAPRSRAVEQLTHLIANAPQDISLAGMFRVDGIDVSEGRHADVPEALDLIELREGAVARGIAERWIRHDPSVLTVLRSEGRVEGVMIRVELTGPIIPPAFEEPVLRAFVDALVARGRLPSSQMYRVTRFFLSRAHGQGPCEELAVLGAAMTRRTLDTRTPYISAQCFDVEGIQAWGEVVDVLRFEVMDDARVTIDGRVWLPCALGPEEVGQVFMGVVNTAWGLAPAEPLGLEPAGPVVEATAPDQEDVTQALRNMRDPIWLATSSLATWLFPATTVEMRGEALRAWLERAVASTGTMRRGERVQKALEASYGADHSNEEAASAAGMGLSTLKRYRRIGVEQVLALAQARATP